APDEPRHHEFVQAGTDRSDAATQQHQVAHADETRLRFDLHDDDLARPLHRRTHHSRLLDARHVEKRGADIPDDHRFSPFSPYCWAVAGAVQPRVSIELSVLPSFAYSTRAARSR